MRQHRNCSILCFLCGPTQGYITMEEVIPGVYLSHPVPGGYKYGDLALQIGGVSKIGTIKYGLESRGTQTRAGLRWRGPAATVNYRPVFSPERALQNNKPLLSKENLVSGPRWVPDTNTDWPTDCRS
jgi:hypothetical protein